MPHPARGLWGSWRFRRMAVDFSTGLVVGIIARARLLVGLLLVLLFIRCRPEAIFM